MPVVRLGYGATQIGWERNGKPECLNAQAEKRQRLP
jgi:hypothetical protein